VAYGSRCLCRIDCLLGRSAHSRPWCVTWWGPVASVAVVVRGRDAWVVGRVHKLLGCEAWRRLCYV
jgi:hypothetical protein